MAPRLPGWLACGISLWLCGCQADYYWHLARGQSRILLGREPVDRVLARGELDSLHAGRLRLVQDVRAYGFDRIGLSSSDSYTCFYDTGGEPVSWNVSASPPDRLVPYVWHFPIAGTVPYKGFFSRQSAQREYDRLRRAGYDVLLRPVSAYSTLGYLADPVLSPMLDYPPDALADLILHELTHGSVYAPGHTDFNESLATFIGQVGSLEFIAQRFGPGSPEVRQAERERRDADRFRDFMAGVVARFDSLYGAGRPRQEVLARRHEAWSQEHDRYRALQAHLETRSYDGFLSWEVNNARLLSYRRYHRDLDTLQRLYASSGWRLDHVLDVGRDCAASGRPWECLADSLTAAAPPP